ncbi:MAG TPA: hypothetical protein VNO75_05365 [Gemmatimonadaceae bacterium]|nr:hypothetical protein [Gemmatimonadaceae bacterium]
MRIRHAVLAAVAVLSMAACKRDNDRSASGVGSSVLFGNASPEAREALAVRVDYRLTDENFAQWEAAQLNLDRLPPSAIPAAAPGVGDVIDRAVARLESSPRARTAIESTGLTVRDFVLQTIALAQAADAAENPRAGNTAMVPAGNLRFVTRYRQRVAPARRARASASAQNADSQVNAGQEMGSDTLAGASSTADSTHVWFGQTQETQRRADSIAAEKRAAEPVPADTAGDSASVIDGRTS